MKNMEELLEYGLPQIGELARPVDLNSRVVQAARSIHRRRVLARTAAVLAALALTVPVTAAVLDLSGEGDRSDVRGDASTAPPTAAPTQTKRSAVDYHVFGPDGYGRVKLGMSLADAMATGDLEIRPGTTKTCTVAHSIPRADEGVTVLISQRFGVVAILGPNIAASTPEGIRINSTAADFKRAYPNFRQDLTARLSAPVPGHLKIRYIAQLIWTGPDPVGSGAGGEWWVVELNLVRAVRDPCLDRFDLSYRPPAGHGTGE
jgi:hypothetical protein